MKKWNTYLFLIFLLTFLSVSRAQEIYSLYKNYLPKEHLKSTNPYTLDKQFKVEAELDPALIYLRILYYQKNLIEKDNDPETNYLNNIRSIIYEKQVSKNIWLNEELNKLAGKYLNEPYYEECKGIIRVNIYSEIKVFGKVSKIIDYNESLDYFFRYLFYSRNSELKYDSLVNYKSLYLSELKLKKDLILEEGKTFPNNDESKNELFVKTIISNWFIIKDEIGTNIPSLADLVFLYVQKKESVNIGSALNVNAKFNSRFKNDTRIITVKDFPSIYNFLSEWSNNEVAEVKPQYNFSVGLNYKHQITKTKTIFSYICLGVGYTFAKYNLDDSFMYNMKNVTQTFDYFDSSTVIKYNHYNQKFSLLSHFNFDLSLSIPIFIFRDFLYFEFGILTYFEKVKYRYEFNYNVTTERYFVGGNQKNEIVNQYSGDSFSESTILVSPLFSCKFLFLDYFTTILQITTNSFVIQTGLQF